MYIRRLLLSRKGRFSCLSVPMCENEYVNRTSFKHRDWVGVSLRPSVEYKIERKISFFLILLLCICSLQVASRRRGPRSS